MDTCTVAVPEMILAFAIPNPGFSSQISRFFRVWPSNESPRSPHHSAYFRLATLLKLTLSAIDGERVAHPKKLSTPVIGAISSLARHPTIVQIAYPSRLLPATRNMHLGPDFSCLWKSFHETNILNHRSLLTRPIFFPHGAGRGSRR